MEETGRDDILNVKLGTTDSVSRPLGVKLMKARTVKVAVYKVTKAAAGGADAIVPDMIPDEQDLEDELNRIYRPQINVTFDVVIEPEPLLVDWDLGPENNTLETNGNNGVLTAEQDTITAAYNARLATPGYVPLNEDITVFVVGTEKVFDGRITAAGKDEGGYGTTSRETKTCWVVGNLGAPMSTNKLLDYGPTDQLRTFAHELGHVLVGIGHPDDDAFPGPAPLPGSDHTRRLMVSGPNLGVNPGCLLVKGEWDKAESWLHDEID